MYDSFVCEEILYSINPFSATILVSSKPGSMVKISAGSCYLIITKEIVTVFYNAIYWFFSFKPDLLQTDNKYMLTHFFIFLHLLDILA
jgi:hypothetical protein